MQRNNELKPIQELTKLPIFKSDTQNYKGNVLGICYGIQWKIKEIAFNIKSDYKNKKLSCIGILNGCFRFISDLFVYFDHLLDITPHFIHMKSYDGIYLNEKMSRPINLFELDDIKNRHILIIDTIIDSGSTYHKINNMFKGMSNHFESVNFCFLFMKKGYYENIYKPMLSLRENIKYVGFIIPNDFVVGYGLDYKGKYRQLDYIAKLEGVDEYGPKDNKEE